MVLRNRSDPRYRCSGTQRNVVSVVVRIVVRIVMAVGGSVGLTGCVFSTTPSRTTPVVSPTTVVRAPGGAPTVPGAVPPAQQAAPTVPPSEAEAAQLAVAAPTTSPSLGSLPPMTSLLPTAESGLRTPVAASRNLWDSWKDKDRERAVLYASVEAVNSLFALPWTPETVDQGCGTVRTSDTGTTCLFIQGTTVKVLRVVGSETLGYKVDRVSTVQQATPQVSVLPNVGEPGVSLTSLLPGGSGAVPGADPASIGGATVATVKGAATDPSASSRRARVPTTRRPQGSTKRAKPAGGQPASAGSTVTVAPVQTPVEPTATTRHTGVPAGAPVVSQVEG